VFLWPHGETGQIDCRLKRAASVARLADILAMTA